MSGGKDYFGKLNKPTMFQIRYLEELGQLTPKQRKRGKVAIIADACGVNHAAVSRFLKNCKEVGYVDDKGKLTDEGTKWVEHYTKIREGLTEYLRDVGLPEKEIPEGVRQMEENMDTHTIKMILDKYRFSRRRVFYDEPTRVNPLIKVVEKGHHPVSFRLLKYNRNKSIVQGLSMADKGFEKPGILRVNNRGLFLVLTLKEIHGRSGMTGEVMKGHVTGVKYEFKGQIVKAKIRNGSVRIPVEACMYKIHNGGGITASLPVAFSASVGNMHMPESTALLVFWF